MENLYKTIESIMYGKFTDDDGITYARTHVCCFNQQKRDKTAAHVCRIRLKVPKAKTQVGIFSVYTLHIV